MSNLAIYNGGDELRMHQLIPYLKLVVPEYWAAKQVYVDSDVHVVAGDFAIWISDGIKESISIDYSVLQRCFDFINEISNNGDEHVQNLVEISILEPLMDEIDNVMTIRNRLNGNALYIFDQILYKWHN